MTDTLTREQLKRIALDELVAEGLFEKSPDRPGWQGWYRITDAGRAAQKAGVQK